MGEWSGLGPGGLHFHSLSFSLAWRDTYPLGLCHPLSRSTYAQLSLHFLFS